MIGAFDQNDSALDQALFSEGLAEQERALEEPVTIRRFVSQSNTPNEYGQAPVPVYQNLPSTAVLVALGVQPSGLFAGVLTAGDIHLQMRTRLHEASENLGGGTHPGDLLIFRGAEYRLIQRPEPIVVGGVVFYNVFMRRTNSQADTTGA